MRFSAYSFKKTVRISANYVSLHRKLQNDWYMEIKVFRRKLYEKMLQY